MMTINKVWVKKDIFYWVSSACYSSKRSTLSLHWDVFQTSLQTKLITTSNFGLRKLWNLLVHIYGHLRVDESKRCNQDENDKCLLKGPLFKNNCILQIYICMTYWNMQANSRHQTKSFLNIQYALKICTNHIGKLSESGYSSICRQ